MVARSRRWRRSIFRNRPSTACSRGGHRVGEGNAAGRKAGRDAEADGRRRRASQGDLRSIGVYPGYAVAQYADFYRLRHVLVLGRVMTGEGGDVILSTAREVLKEQFPELEETLRLHVPGEKENGTGRRSPRPACPQFDKARNGDVPACRGWRIKPLARAHSSGDGFGAASFGIRELQSRELRNRELQSRDRVTEPRLQGAVVLLLSRDRDGAATARSGCVVAEPRP